MNRQPRTLATSIPARSLLAIAIASSFLLGACASGGGGHETVSVAPPPPAPPPPAPPPPPPVVTRLLTLPAAPAPHRLPTAPSLSSSANVVIDVPAGANPVLPTRSSSGSLTKTGEGRLFEDGDVRFDGGTTVSAGILDAVRASAVTAGGQR